jgi:ribokinase
LTQIDRLDNIVIIGSSIVDIAMYSTRLPSVGESLVASSMNAQVGGKASNQAIAVSRLGVTPWLLSKVGNDEWAAQALRLWRSEGVRTEFVTFHESEMTGMGVAFITSGGENWTVSSLNANRYLSPTDIEAAAARISSSKVLSIHFNPPLETICCALRLAKLNDVTTILNASPVELVDGAIFEMIDILVVNQFEALQLSGCEVNNATTAYEAARSLLRKGPKTVIVSLGNDGLVVATASQERKYEAFPVAAVDTVGAGDALIAGLSVAIAEGRSLFDAAHFANAVSALAVTRQGTWQGMPTRGVVDRFLES